MIRLTRLNGKEFVLNSELIEFVEATPDVVVTLTSKNKFLVQESLDEIIARVVAYRNRIAQPWQPGPNSTGETE